MKSRALLLLAAAACGCSTYEEKPLVPAEAVAHADRLRREAAAPSGEALTLDVAAAWLAAHGPDLRDARAEHEAALALARVPTPLPNPSIEVGPAFGFGPEVVDRKVQPFGSLGLSFPTGGRLGREDEVNAMRAARLGVELRIAHRTAYLRLRRLFVALAVRRARRERIEELRALAEDAVVVGRRLVEAGEATALDVGLLELDVARTKIAAVDARALAAAAEAELAALLGVHVDLVRALPPGTLPELPTEAPSDLLERLVANHPGLAGLRGDYDVAEAELRLAIAKQYPDVNFGLSVEREVGEPKTVAGLSIGIDIPIFDRNQQGIATASSRRETVRARYEAEAARALALLDGAREAVAVGAERLSLLRGDLLEKARAQLDLTRRAMEAGATDALRMLEAERAWRDAVLDALDAELSVREAWLSLEEAVGSPLVMFPGETEAMRPAGPFEEERR